MIERSKECVTWTALGVVLTLCAINGLRLLADVFNQRAHDERSLMLDSNGDKRPDILKTYLDGHLVRIERYRNFDRRIDLIQNYSRGVPVLDFRDDDFEGKPKTVKEFSSGTPTIVRPDPKERGCIGGVDSCDIGKRLRATLFP